MVRSDVVAGTSLAVGFDPNEGSMRDGASNEKGVKSLVGHQVGDVRAGTGHQPRAFKTFASLTERRTGLG